MNTANYQGQIANLKQKKLLLVFLVFLLVLVMIWVLVSLFSSQNKLKISSELKQLAKPLTPDFDMTAIENLEKQQFFTKEELASFKIYKIFKAKNKDQASLVEISVDEEQLQAELEGKTLTVTPSPTPSLLFVPESSPSPAATSSSQATGSSLLRR